MIGLIAPLAAGWPLRPCRRSLADPDALQTDAETRAVHHGEHCVEAAVLLADQPALGAAGVAIDHHTGRRGVNAELVLDAGATHVVAPAGRAVLADEELRNKKQRNAPGAGRRVGQTSEDKMDDIIGHVVLAISDEDLLTKEMVRPVRRRYRAGLDRVEIRTGLRFGEVHRAGPFAADQLGEVEIAQGLRREARNRMDRPFAEQGTEGEAHRSAGPDLEAGGVDRVRQSHAAVLAGAGDARPAAARPSAIDVPEARRRSHDAILIARALEIADPVERRDGVRGEAPRLVDDRGGGRKIQVRKETLLCRFAEVRHMLERKQDIGDRRTVGHQDVPFLTALPQRL
jgi:hypothetical protein